MEKLLHERLREAIKNGDNEIYVGDLRVGPFYSTEMEAIADEIERCYIPRPRFEDGEPVQFGDETDNLESVNIIEFRQDGTFQLGEKRESGWGTYIGIYEAGELVKRLTPKVCDADGVEINRGDRVYPIEKKCNSGTEGYIVNHIEVDDGINSPRVYFIDDVGMLWMKADQLTHERPVFDADGARICKGDTVWTKYGDKAIVTTIYSDDTKIVEVRIDDALIDYAPNSLTHHEPDSLESIAKYAKDEAVKYAGCIEPLNKVAARLAALIERGA